jgi:hypothetical protein
MNIVTPKIRALQMGSAIQSGKFIENGSNGIY